MKIKLDENLPARLVELLADLGHDVDTVPQERLAGADDSQVWQAAQEAARFFITQDLDFSDTRRFEPGTHHGILLLRLKEPSRAALVHRVAELFRSEPMEAWTSCTLVATDRKLRIRTPS